MIRVEQTLVPAHHDFRRIIEVIVTSQRLIKLFAYPVFVLALVHDTPILQVQATVHTWQPQCRAYMSRLAMPRRPLRTVLVAPPHRETGPSLLAKPDPPA